MIEEHRHCIVCGKATSTDKIFCSPSCEELFKSQQKRMARSRLIMFVLFGIMFAVIEATSLLSQ